MTTKNNQPDLADGYEVQNILSDSAFRYINPFIFFTISKRIREKKATHLILEHPYYGWLGFLLKKFCGIRLIVHSHNMEGNRWRSLGKWWWRILWNYEKQPTGAQILISSFRMMIEIMLSVNSVWMKNKCITVSFGTEIPAAPTI